MNRRTFMKMISITILTSPLIAGIDNNSKWNNIKDRLPIKEHMVIVKFDKKYMFAYYNKENYRWTVYVQNIARESDNEIFAVCSPPYGVGIRHDHRWIYVKDIIKDLKLLTVNSGRDNLLYLIAENKVYLMASVDEYEDKEFFIVTRDKGQIGHLSFEDHPVFQKDNYIYHSPEMDVKNSIIDFNFENNVKYKIVELI